MYTSLSEIQQQNYYNLCGETYQRSEMKGQFSTSKPYNNELYKFSPWGFEYVFDKEKGYLLCELSHKITDKRMYGWNQNGEELPKEIVSKYFKSNKVA